MDKLSNKQNSFFSSEGGTRGRTHSSPTIPISGMYSPPPSRAQSVSHGSTVNSLSYYSYGMVTLAHSPLENPSPLSKELDDLIRAINNIESIVANEESDRVELRTHIEALLDVNQYIIDLGSNLPSEIRAINSRYSPLTSPAASTRKQAPILLEENHDDSESSISSENDDVLDRIFEFEDEHTFTK